MHAEAPEFSPQAPFHVKDLREEPTVARLGAESKPHVRDVKALDDQSPQSVVVPSPILVPVVCRLRPLSTAFQRVPESAQGAKFLSVRETGCLLRSPASTSSDACSTIIDRGTSVKTNDFARHAGLTRSVRTWPSCGPILGEPDLVIDLFSGGSRV